MTLGSPLACAIALLLSASAAAAQPVGGVLPLKHGFYVAEGTSCRSPPFAVLQSYDGRGVGDPHSHDCRLQVTGHQGAVVRGRETCVDAGVGPAPRSTTAMTLRLDGPDRYAQITPVGAPTRFRWCPAAAVLKGR